MRYIELVCISVILALFSSVFTSMIFQFFRMDKELVEIRKKTESMIFISESFYNSCKGEGFFSLEEWKRVCTSLWSLESIDCEPVGGAGSSLYCARWKGPYGNGEIYAKKYTGK